jgi:choline kinase
MQAVILAAGFGSRLKSVTGGKAKPLIDIGGRPLILHQLEALADHGVGPVLVIVGHQADEVQQVIGSRAEVLLNDRFAETNSLYSLWLARDWIKGPFVLLNCDLFFDPEILGLVLEEPGNILAYDSTSSRGREQTKVAIRQRRVADLGKDLPPGSARGESLGLLKFEKDGATALLRTAEALVREGQTNAWVIEATRAICGELAIYGINVAGHAWTEIDFPYDLDVARREVWPAIWRGRWRQQVYWKRTRWVAGIAAAFLLALLGWTASTRVGPASLDWETVPVQGAELVRLERHGTTQRWWRVPADWTIRAAVSGPQARVEVRVVLPQTMQDSLPYVLAVSVDSGAEGWYSLHASPDSEVRWAGGAVGDRDRIELQLGPGPHELRLKRVAGEVAHLLIRFRQLEERDD